MLRNITYAMLGLERSDQRSQAVDGVTPPRRLLDLSTPT
jgi:hypothetical protein